MVTHPLGALLQACSGGPRGRAQGDRWAEEPPGPLDGGEKSAQLYLAAPICSYVCFSCAPVGEGAGEPRDHGNVPKAAQRWWQSWGRLEPWAPPACSTSHPRATDACLSPGHSLCQPGLARKGKGCPSSTPLLGKAQTREREGAAAPCHSCCS